jgi:Family of unknown function (DUF6282)
MKNVKSRPSIIVFAALLCTTFGLAVGPSPAQEPRLDDWNVDPVRGPVDLGLTDQALVGAIDVHLHVDPDAPGSGGVIRAIDVFEATRIAAARGMRGFVFKTHQDTGSASLSYMVRKHVSPTFEIFARMASNYATGGVNVAALEHFTQIKGGWSRILEMPTRDSITSTTRPGSMDRENLAKTRPWMLMMPPETPPFIAVSRNGDLLPEVKHLIGVLAKIRTVDSNGRMVLATGHATPEEHLMLAREGRKQGINVLLTHPGDIPQLAEAARLGAFIEVNASRVYRNEAGRKEAAALIRKVGAEHVIIGTDCGQTTNVYPTDCLVLAARGLRAVGITPREIDLMYKINPAKLLDLPPPDVAALSK